MRIYCDCEFLDGTTRYYKDDVVTVPDEDGARFVAAKWAHVEGASAGAMPDAESVTLEVTGAAHTAGDNHG